MLIRTAKIEDAEAIHSIHLSAFPEIECNTIAKLAVRLLTESSMPPTLSLIAEAADHAIGHLAFSPVTIDYPENIHGYILAPLAIQPDHQNQGIGSQLVNIGLERLAGVDADIVFVYGNPNYYSRFGFNGESASRYVPPYTLQFPLGWQGLVIRNTLAEGKSAKISCVPALSDPSLW